MMKSIWIIVIVFAGISLFTSNPAPLIAGLILAGIGMLAERIYK
jgi:hypothetical protein